MVLGIYGAGGLGRGLYDWITRDSDAKWSDYFFIDDTQDEGTFYGIKRIPFDSISRYYDSSECEIIIAIGEPSTREKLYLKTKEVGYKMATFIDSQAIVSNTAVIGEGVIICSFVVVDSQAMIANNCLIEQGVIIGHNVNVGQSTTVSSYSIIGGYTCLGKQSFLGMKTVVKDRITLGQNIIAAMGSIIFKDVSDNMTVMGNPARVTRGNDSHKVWS